MALYREFELAIGPGSEVDLVTGSLATVISGLDCSFNIKRSATPADNKGTFKIYNASADTRQNVLARGNNVVVSAGHTDEKNTSIIFMGSIETVNTYYSGTDWISEITAVSYKGANKDTATKVLSLGYPKNTALTTVISELATAMGLSPVGLESLAGITLPNGLYAVNTSKILLEYIRDFAYKYGIGIVIDQTNIYTFVIGQPARLEVVTLDYTSSLLSINEASKDSQRQSLLGETKNPKKILMLKTLLDPKIAPMASIVLNVKPYVGTYLVKEVNYYGDNFGGDFNCKIKVESID